MKRLLAALLLAALPAFAQTKESLEQRMSPKPTGTAGDIPYAVSTTTIGWIAHATGTKCLQQVGAATPTWVDCNTAAGGPFVKLQASYPGTQQTGSFNVSDAAGSGPYTVAYPTAPPITPATYSLLNLYSNGSLTVGDRYRLILGDVNTTAHQLSISYYHASYGSGQNPSWALNRASYTAGTGLTLLGKGSNTQVCVATDGAAGDGYPVVCDSGDVFGVGESGGSPALQVDATGNLKRIRGVTYTWPTSLPGATACMRITNLGTISFDTTCGSGATGGVSSITFSAPLTGGTITTSGTVGLSITPADDGGAVAKQAATPGTAQTGHANLSGTIKAGAFSGPLTGNVTGNLTGTADKAAALSTSGAAVDVSGSAPPGGSGYACITTDATHCTWQVLTGGGTVTSVGNGTIGPLFSASWATATTTPALSLDLASQSANCVVAGPSTGSPAVPTCRSLVTNDFPASGVSASTYGDATHVAQITVDATGRLTAVTNVSITGGGGTSTAFAQDQFNGDGSTTAFTLVGTPVTNGVAYVALNGLPQPTTAWSLAASTVTMTTAPILGALLAVGYYTALPGSVTHTQEDFTGAASTDFTLAHAPAVNGVLMVALRGMVQPQTSWSIVSSTTLRFSSAVPTGDAVSISYNY